LSIREFLVALLHGAVSISELPPNRGMLLYLNLFRVKAPDSPAPYRGDPPPAVEGDMEKIYDQVDLEQESNEARLECGFSFDRPAGYYFVQVRALLFRVGDGNVVAQSELFFFGRRPLHVANDQDDQITLPVTWPSTSLNSLHKYQTFKPKSNRPWWRLW
jgi:hypothetical protein